MIMDSEVVSHIRDDIDWSSLVTVAATILAIVVSLLVFLIIKRRPTFPTITPNDQSIATVCLGRPFKVGMLYDSRKDSLLTKKILWKEDAIKKATVQEKEEVEVDDYEVISNDTLATKVGQLGIETDLSLSVISESVEVSKSAEYLHDIRTSSRQARVVLKCQHFTKCDKLIMKKPPKPVDPKLLTDGTATHIVVGIKYGCEAFFVFDREVPDDEDYDKVCREMESLVLKISSIAKRETSLSDEEGLFANKLHFQVHSDQTITQTLSSFNDVISIYKRFLSDSRTEVPKVAWLYPLHLLHKKAPTVHVIEHSLIMKTLNVMDSFNTLVETATSLSKHGVCKCFPAIRQQLEQCKTSLEGKQATFKRELASILPEIRQTESNDDLIIIIKGSENEINSNKVWLNDKLDELEFLLECIKKLQSITPGFKTTQEQIAKYRRENRCIVKLDFQFCQKNMFTSKENRWYNDSGISSEINDKIDDFVKYAKANKETLWIVTSSNSDTNDENEDEEREIDVILKLYEPGSSDFQEFEFPSCPGKPIAVKKTYDKVELKWSTPLYQSRRPMEYVVFYRQVKKKNSDYWVTYASVDDNKIEVNGLEAETKYEFKVAAKYSFGMGPESVVNNAVITEPYPLAIRIQKDKELAEIHTSRTDGPQTYKLKVNEVYHDEISKIKKNVFGNSSSLSGIPTKVIMVMGATGAGKSTLINGMVNYILNVEFEDDFRFKLIYDETKESQAHSQTDIITAYTFYHQDGFKVPYNVTIIDTPGFGDTRGLERDKEIPRQVAQLFSLKGAKGIDEIHAIGFVTQAALVRLTPTQRYIFTSILEIFGNDIKGNIFVMATFADNPRPKVINALEEANVPFATSFPFNNSGLYEDPQGETTALFWKMGYKSFIDFFTHISKVNPTSLQLTSEVLKEREQLQATLSGMQKLIQIGLARMDSLRKEEEVLKEKEADIKANEKFEYEVRITKQRKVDLVTGDSAGNCIKCHMTCHYPCNTPDHEMYECASMDIGGVSGAKCEVCPGKCSWRDHHNNRYRFENYEVVEIKRSEELRERFKVAEAEAIDVKEIIAKLQNDLSNLSEEVYGYVEEVKRCHARLNEIALRPNSFDEQGYLDVLIETEKQEKKEGYQDRINSYTQLREQARILAKSTEELDKLDKQIGDKKAWWKFWLK